jgi:hypothetical protein
LTVSLRLPLILALCSGLAACGGSSPFASFGAGARDQVATRQAARVRGAENVAVNRYLWSAAIDVLDFMPIESVDPFTGVIVFGYGVPPGGSTAYRATVYIRDPALDARSLNVALATRNGPVSGPTLTAIEDAILSRARQIRIADRPL